MNYKIDNLQYCKWSREVFKINREAGLDAVHVTVVYHEDFNEFNSRVDEWNTFLFINLYSTNISSPSSTNVMLGFGSLPFVHPDGI